jgi:hypothetical protein
MLNVFTQKYPVTSPLTSFTLSVNTRAFGASSRLCHRQAPWLVLNVSFLAPDSPALAEVDEAAVTEPVVVPQVVVAHTGSASTLSPEFHSSDSSGVASTFHIACIEWSKFISDCPVYQNKTFNY